MSPRAHFGTLALCLLLVVLFTQPLATDPAHLLPRHWDPGVFSWVMASNSHRLLRDPLDLFQGNVMYPHGSAVSYSEPLLVPTLTYAPVFWTTGNPVLAYNLTLMFFWSLSGLTMAWVAHRVTGNLAAAVLAGMVFVLCPYRIEYFLEFQMHLSFALPLALWGWYRFLVRPDWRPLALAVGAVATTFYATIYYALILCLALAVFSFVYLAFRWRGWQPAALWRGAVGAAAGLAVVVPLLVPYARTRAELGFERILEEEPLFHSADLLTYVETRQTWLYRLAHSDAETVLFMGFIPTALVLFAVWSLLLRRRQRALLGGPGRLAAALTVAGAAAFVPAALLARSLGDEHVNWWPWAPVVALTTMLVGGLASFVASGHQRYRAGVEARELEPHEWTAACVYLAAVFFAISLGPWIRLGGEILGPGVYPALHAAMPFLRAIRVISRFGVIFTVAMSLLVALGAAELLRRSGRRWAVATVLGLLIVVELYSGRLDYGPVEWPPSSPAYDVVAESQPAALLEVPFDAYLLDADEMLRSTYHWAYLLNGVSGFVPRFTEDLAHRLRSETVEEFPTELSQRLLRSVYPLRFILVHRNLLPEQEYRKWENLDRKMAGVRLAGRYGDDELYEILPVPEEGLGFERRFSFDYVNRHPSARLRLSASTERAEGAADTAAWATLRFNGADLERLQLGGSATERRLDLPRPYARSAANLLELDFDYRVEASSDEVRYRLGDAGPTLLLDVRLAALGEANDAASAEVNGEQLFMLAPGYHLLVLDAASGRIASHEHFATGDNERANRLLNRQLRQLEDGTPVALIGFGGAGAWLDDTTVRAIRRFGGNGDLRDHPRGMHLLLGIKGADVAVEQVGIGELQVRHGGQPGRLRLKLEDFEMLPAAR